MFSVSVIALFGLSICSCDGNLLSIEERLDLLEKTLNEKDTGLKILEKLVFEQANQIKKLTIQVNSQALTLKSLQINNQSEQRVPINSTLDEDEKVRRLVDGPEFPQQKVAFFAKMNNGDQVSYGNHETFHFSEELDAGGGYNDDDDIFDVPVSGVYVFTWTIVPTFWGYIQTELIVGGVVKGAILSDSQEIHDIHQSSGTVVVHVTKGTHVYIRRGVNSNGNILIGDNYGTNCFAGWLLFEN